MYRVASQPAVGVCWLRSLAQLTASSHKIVAKRGAGFTIMVGDIAFFWDKLKLTLSGCRRVRARKDYLHQHALFYDNQELRRSQAPSY
jgi:hypothetical protein